MEEHDELERVRGVTPEALHLHVYELIDTIQISYDGSRIYVRVCKHCNDLREIPYEPFQALMEEEEAEGGE